MKQDRFLVGILAGIGILAVISLALFFSRQKQVAYQPENTPQAVVNNYALALQKNDYQRAYGYLAERERKPGYALFRAAFENQSQNLSESSLEVGDADVGADQATVAVTIVQSGGGLFEPLTRRSDSAVLVRQGGAWKITGMPYPYWSYDWYPADGKPVPPFTPAPIPAPSATP